MDQDEVDVHKNAKKKIGQYPAILTSTLVNNTYVRVHVGLKINLDVYITVLKP